MKQTTTLIYKSLLSTKEAKILLAIHNNTQFKKLCKEHKIKRRMYVFANGEIMNLYRKRDFQNHLIN